MAQYHVGCGITAIWAGILNKRGDRMSRKSLIVVSAIVGCTAGVAFLFGNIDGAIVGYLCAIWLLLLSDKE